MLKGAIGAFLDKKLVGVGVITYICDWRLYINNLIENFMVGLKIACLNYLRVCWI